MERLSIWKLLLIAAVWGGIVGFSATPGAGPSCVSDRPFGEPEQSLDPALWEGWWKKPGDECPEGESCFRITVASEQPGTILVDSFDVERYDVYELRQATPVVRLTNFWFGFFLYSCSDTGCSDTMDSSLWTMVRNDGASILGWVDCQHLDRFNYAVMENILPGEYDGSELGLPLLGSIFDEEHVQEILDGALWRLNNECPSVMVREPH